jgi:hypothetical protein
MAKRTMEQNRKPRNSMDLCICDFVTSYIIQIVGGKKLLSRYCLGNWFIPLRKVKLDHYLLVLWTKSNLKPNKLKTNM